MHKAVAFHTGMSYARATVEHRAAGVWGLERLLDMSLKFKIDRSYWDEEVE